MGKGLHLSVCFLFLVFWFDFGESIRWLSLQHSHLHWNLTSGNNNPGRGIRSGIRSPCTIAKRRYGFLKLQAKLCRNSIEAMPHVQAAAVLAADTCRNVFRYRRWNCSSIATAPYLTPDLTRATREQAFVYALSSAALTYTVARACASGGLYSCSCAGRPATPTDGRFQWGGCGDNVKWGVHFARRWSDNGEKSMLSERRGGKGKEKREERAAEEVAATNLHNNRVGRKIVSESLHTQCKCHGVSGSCNIKTCWRALPSMAEIGHKLLVKYTNAVEVPQNVGERSLLEDTSRKKHKIVNHMMIYLAKSPDYCTKDEQLGSYGTVGRYCNVTSDGTESCRKLCCGRGYRTVVEEKLERCKCKFYNCCYVKCKICRTMTRVYECQ